MKLTVADIERELQYIGDYDQGSRQYRHGFVRALDQFPRQYRRVRKELHRTCTIR
ncbi:MAG: hypothetical protein JO210_07500 [Acidobacteriaceae bacterium]|nr:hypothetical protein [Acidobacteriaceae bacterium]